MFTGSDSFDSVVAYMLGYDDARDGGPLIGFRQWLVLENGKFSNAPWPLLIRSGPDEGNVSDEELISKLCESLSCFLENKDKIGIWKIIASYEKMMSLENGDL